MATKPPSPTREQVSTFSLAIDVFRTADATLTGWMDYDGDMLVSVDEDGLTTHAVFGTDGQIKGDWS